MTAGRWLGRLGVAATAAAASLVLADRSLVWTDRDMAQLAPVLYAQQADVDAYLPVDDPVLRFRLRASYRSPETRFHLSTDRWQARSTGLPHADRSAGPRLLWVGASTIFGAQVDDDQTLPARLESDLRTRWRSDAEVFNLGHSGYSVAQIARLARLALDEIPDVDGVFVTLTNRGPSPWLRPEDLPPDQLRTMLQSEPLLWLEVDPTPPQLPLVGPRARDRLHWALLRNSGAYRMLRAVALGRSARQRTPSRWSQALDARELAALAEHAAALDVPVLFVHYPAAPHTPPLDHVEHPSVSLEREGLSDAARDPHPPADHLAQHASALGALLEARGILGPDGHLDLTGADGADGASAPLPP
ncbi:MAG: SGNH/GDSL hydrolase family protein [Alphaproteobacteria bacterium]|nr:SGNH/GDSL hydrolase family protein [Alphaproteobacteria bacterium]